DMLSRACPRGIGTLPFRIRRYCSKVCRQPKSWQFLHWYYLLSRMEDFYALLEHLLSVLALMRTFAACEAFVNGLSVEHMDLLMMSMIVTDYAALIFYQNQPSLFPVSRQLFA